MKKFRAWLTDTAERTVAAYVESFLGLVLLAQVISISTVEAAGGAALPAGLAVLKAAVAAWRAGTVSPASFVKPPSQ